MMNDKWEWVPSQDFDHVLKKAREYKKLYIARIEELESTIDSQTSLLERYRAFVRLVVPFMETHSNAVTRSGSRYQELAEARDAINDPKGDWEVRYSSPIEGWLWKGFEQGLPYKSAKEEARRPFEGCGSNDPLDDRPYGRVGFDYE